VTGHCKDCKHWSPFNPNETADAGVREEGYHLDARAANRLGLCGKIDDHTRYGFWKNKTTYVVDDVLLAVTEDLSGCSGLRTAAEFGCVLFEAK
jgi:hypothetical protein